MSPSGKNVAGIAGELGSVVVSIVDPELRGSLGELPRPPSAQTGETPTSVEAALVAELAAADAAPQQVADAPVATSYRPSGPADANWLGGQDAVVKTAERLLGEEELPMLMLCGGPGHGKSTVARAVAVRLQAAGTWVNTGTAYTANLRDLTDLDCVVGHLGVAIGAITAAQRRRAGMSLDELLPYVAKHHADPSERIGIILDDCDYLLLGETARIALHDTLRAILDAAPGLQFLLTAQQPLRVPGDGGAVPCVLVPRLGREAATDVLARLTPNLNASEAAQLANLAGGVPATLYALSCAVGNGVSAADLIAHASGSGCLHSGAPQLASLAEACSYSLGTLVNEYRDALVLLGIFPGPFDIEGAAAVLGVRGKVMVTGLLKVLTQAHVILRSSQGEGSMYVLHPLVRDVLASDAAGYISARSERYEAARARFVEHFGALFQRVGREYACNAVAGDAHSKFLAHRHSIDAMMRWVGTPAQPPHCEALYCSLLWSSWDMLQQLLRLPELEVFTRQCVAMAQDVDDKPAEAQALVMDAWVLVQHGRYQAALEELDRASEILQAVHANGHADLATEMVVRACALMGRGSFAEAKPTLQRALELRIAAFGWAHPQVAEVQCHLGALLMETADFDAAEPLQRAALEVRKSRLGDEHPAVATSLLRLAQLCAAVGDWPEAEEHYRSTIAIARKLYGPEHELIGSALTGLALFRGAEGFTDEAALLASNAAAILEKSLGKDHPRLAEPLLVSSQLGLRRGSVEEVEESVMRAVEVTHRHLRSDHPSVIAALNALGALKRCRGDLEDAAALHAASVGSARNLLGARHPLVAASLTALAAVKEKQGDLSSADALLKQANTILEALFESGTNHPAAVAVWSGRASVAMAGGDSATAEGFYRRILAAAGDESRPGCAGFCAPVALNNLAVMTKGRGDLDTAEKLYRRSVALTERSYGGEHLSVAKAMNNLASLLQEKARYLDAEALYRRAAEIISVSLGPQHIDVASSLNGLAVVLKKRGKLRDAEKLYRGALEIQRNSLPGTHPDLAVSYNNLASLHQSSGLYESAERYYRRALEIRKKFYGDSHATVATSLSNLASLMNDMGHYDEAESLYNDGLAIREQVLGAQHQDVAHSLLGLAQLYRNTGNRRMSEDYHRRALALREKALGPLHLQVAESCDGLAALLAGLEEDEVTVLSEDTKGVGLRLKKALTFKRRSSGTGVAKPADSEVREAEDLYRRAIDIRREVLGVSHPDMAQSLNGLALILKRKKSYGESERIYRLAVQISERNHGTWHPSIGTSMHELAELLDRQDKHSEAEPFYRRALEIWEATLGYNHPHVAVGLGNLARVLHILSRPTEAAEVEEQAEEVRANASKNNQMSLLSGQTTPHAAD
eukprot:jgi/Tetstr1/459262/TSEL_004662.t1